MRAPDRFDRRPLNWLMSASFYPINQALREGQPLTGGCGADLDYAGWGSKEDFAKDVSEMFAGASLSHALGTRKGDVAYRGITMRREALAAVLAEGRIFDAGYAFASESRDAALSHLRVEDRMIKRVPTPYEDAALVPVLLEITIGRYSLYIPNEREDDPFGLRTAGGMTRSLAHGQHVLDRHSVLRITEVDDQATPLTIRCEHRL